MAAPVRVRIAPSPTGPLHVGTARTALFNYLFAQKHGGSFIVRSEDTDVARSNEEFTTDILSGLRWLGLTWEEGPDVGGPLGPYRQSERETHYAAALATLLRSGAAGEEAGAVHFRVTTGTAPVVHDLIRGDVTFPRSELRDFVIAKPSPAGGGKWVPLFHLAVVVDDAAMGITHVIRGEDHLSNTPRHILLQQALGLPTPEYAHLPLLLDPNRRKLSKRDAVTGIREYRAEGYLPEAMVNFLALLGWNPKNDEEVFTLGDLVTRFDLAAVQKGGAIFDLRKLDWLQRQHLRRRTAQDLAALARPFLERQGMADVPAERLERALVLFQERGGPLARLGEDFRYLFTTPTGCRAILPWKNATAAETADALTFASQELSSFPETSWESPTALQHALLTSLEREGRDRATVLWPLRVALSGQAKSPSPGEIAWVLGREETRARIAAAQGMLREVR